MARAKEKEKASPRARGPLEREQEERETLKAETAGSWSALHLVVEAQHISRETARRQALLEKARADRRRRHHLPPP